MNLKQNGKIIKVLTYETAKPLSVPTSLGRLEKKNTMFDDLFDDAPAKELIQLVEEKKEILNAALNPQLEPSVVDEFDFLNPTPAPQSTAIDSDEKLPRNTPEVKATQHKVSIDEIFSRHLNNKSAKSEIEQAKIQQNEEVLYFSRLDMNNPDDRNKIASRLVTLADACQEGKNRFATLSRLARESDAKNKVTVWDRERRGTNTLNGSLRLTDPRKAKELNDEESKERSKAKRRQTKKFNKFEAGIAAGLECGETAESLIEMNKGKYTEKQVMDAIDKINNPEEE